MVVLGVLIRRDLPNASRPGIRCHALVPNAGHPRAILNSAELCTYIKQIRPTRRFTWRDGSHPSEEPRRRQFESVSGRFFSCEYLFF